MLAFDIETTGLTNHDVVTCACAYDEERQIEETFVFAGVSDPARCGVMKEDFMRLLDEADRLCAFNGVRFDVPFMARCWDIPSPRVGSWIRKLFDPFEFCKLSLNRTFSLNKLLSRNGLECKSGSGLEAVHMAAAGRYQELGMYCMQDARLTHQVCSLPCIKLPEPHAPLCICVGCEDAPVQTCDHE